MLSSEAGEDLSKPWLVSSEDIEELDDHIAAQISDIQNHLADSRRLILAFASSGDVERVVELLQQLASYTLREADSCSKWAYSLADVINKDDSSTELLLKALSFCLSSSDSQADPEDFLLNI